MFRCEQVIGRVLRVLNRPKNPTTEQINEYNRNLSETLKLAKDLSGFGFNWRKVGRWLMAFALAAAVSSVVAFFFASAPLSIALAGAAVFLGAVGWCLNRYTSITMDELVTDFVNNVKPFPSDTVLVHNASRKAHGCGTGYDESFDKDANYLFNKYLCSHVSGRNISQFAVFLDLYADTSTDDSAIAITIEKHLLAGIKKRLIAGDEYGELDAQFEKNANTIEHSKDSEFKYFERVAAISGMTVITHKDNKIDLVETSLLYATSQLDPLGADDPQAALLKAYEEHKSGLSLLQNVSEKLSGLGNSISSFFAGSRKAKHQFQEVIIKEEELLPFMM